MAGRWTPDRVFAAGAYSFTSSQGDVVPTPFSPSGTAATRSSSGSSTRPWTGWPTGAARTTSRVLHVPWYGFLWAEIYNGSEMETLPGYSWSSWLEGHKRMADIALVVRRT